MGTASFYFGRSSITPPHRNSTAIGNLAAAVSQFMWAFG